jgi:hypothetical protein
VANGKALNSGLLVLQALSSALPMVDEYRTNKKRQTELSRGAAERNAAQQRADTRVGDAIAQHETSQAPLHELTPDYTAAARRGRTGYDAPLPAGASGDFRADQAGAEAGVKAYGNRYAQMVAGLDGAVLQREREDQSRARASSDLANEGRIGGTADYLARLRARSVRGNPWTSLLSQLGTSIARNYEAGEPARRGGVWDEVKPFPRVPIPPIEVSPLARR